MFIFQKGSKKMVTKVKTQEKSKKEGNMGVEAAENFVKVFEILGSRARLKILKIITNEEKCVNFLSKKLKLSQPTVSYHLRLLLNLGLVKQYKSAQWVRYKLNKEKLAELLASFSKIYEILKKGKRRKKI